MLPRGDSFLWYLLQETLPEHAAQSFPCLQCVLSQLKVISGNAERVLMRKLKGLTDMMAAPVLKTVGLALLYGSCQRMKTPSLLTIVFQRRWRLILANKDTSEQGYFNRNAQLLLTVFRVHRSYSHKSTYIEKYTLYIGISAVLFTAFTEKWMICNRMVIMAREGLF